MKGFFSTILAVILITSLIFSACTSTPPTTPQTPLPPTTNNNIPEPQPPKPTEPPTIYPLTVTDDLGRTVKIDKMPQRIVSLAPSITEILFALGLDDRIIGVTDYCDYPEAAKAKPRVSSYTTPNMEKLVSLEPDLIFAESIHEKTVLPALEKLNLTIVAISAESVDTVLNDIELIGKIANTNQKAKDLINVLKNKIESVSEKTKQLPASSRPKVLYVIWHQPIWTMGSKTYINDLIQMAGGFNIFADQFEKSRTVSLESIVSANPQIIIVSGMGTSGDIIYNSIKKEERLKTTDAIKNNRIYKISDSNIIERPGPRIVEGLQELAKLIHPEVFGALK